MPHWTNWPKALLAMEAFNKHVRLFIALIRI